MTLWSHGLPRSQGKLKPLYHHYESTYHLQVWFSTQTQTLKLQATFHLVLLNISFAQKPHVIFKWCSLANNMTVWIKSIATFSKKACKFTVKRDSQAQKNLQEFPKKVKLLQRNVFDRLRFSDTESEHF